MKISLLVLTFLLTSFTAFAQGEHRFDCKMNGKYEEYTLLFSIDHFSKVIQNSKEILSPKVEIKSYSNSGMLPNEDWEQGMQTFWYTIMDNTTVPLEKFVFEMTYEFVPNYRVQSYVLTKNADKIKSDLMKINLNATDPINKVTKNLSSFYVNADQNYIQIPVIYEIGTKDNINKVYHQFDLRIECFKPSVL